MSESKVVEAVGISVSTANPTKGLRSKVLEAVMADAARQAQAEGVKDPAVIRDRMLRARSQAKAMLDKGDLK